MEYFDGSAETHPHFYGERGANNTLYVARKDLALDGVAPQRIAGGGIFSHFSPGLRLTAQSASRPGIWDLPAWFYPVEQRPPLTYHGDAGRWRVNGTRTELKSAARGQEFILDCDVYHEAIPWVAELFGTGNGKV